MTKNGTWFHVAVEGGSLIKIPPINQVTDQSEYYLKFDEQISSNLIISDHHGGKNCFLPLCH